MCVNLVVVIIVRRGSVAGVVGSGAERGRLGLGVQQRGRRGTVAATERSGAQQSSASVIDPDWRLNTLWQAVMLGAISYNTFSAPLRIA